ncbi:hypothetical protein HRbin22_00131 [Candidatus Thermoflexus japonica]|uniref:DUF4352 domain-containing protein n=1 Tax=Candidatus Thermoflexus japonica TaxID=2035417 RepID=A0A2H5Y385_9CHLR|nr:hypothetical protein HRbin22_00131 [Candidatus Thermoflexus japonica]
MIEPEGKPSGFGNGLRALLSRWREPARGRWEQIPPALRPWLLASAAVGMMGLVLFIAGLILLVRAAQPPTSPSPMGGGGTPSFPFPLRLRVKDTAFRVAPLAVRGGSWPVPRGRGDTAYWMEGTFTNLVFGLSDRPETRRLVEGLREGDVLEVEMSAGPALRFQVSGRQQVRPEDTAILSQHRPGLTLLLVGGEPRWAVTASPLPEMPPALLTTGRVPIGLPVQVGSIRLVLTGVEPRWSGPGIPGDFVGVVLRFEMAHTGEAPLAIERFEMNLIDAAGRRYQPTPLENVPIPSGRIAPGSTVSGQVAYLIPRNSAEGVLIWQFNPLPGRAAPVEVEFELPRPTPTPEPETLLQIQIQSAQWMPEGQVLVIRGGIGNPGEQPVTLEAAEVELVGPEGQPAPLVEASPALPWMIPAGRNLGFELRFAFSTPGAAVLRIGRERFQIR